MITASSGRSANTADTVVIGGGLHGCSTALHLALRGMSVIVIEKDYIARHASGVNAGGVRRLGRAFSEIPLSVASATMWRDIEGLVGDSCGFVSSCQIKVAESQLHIDQLTARAQQVLALGYDHEQIIDEITLRQRLPAVAPHCVGGMIVEDDGHANPFRTVQAFRNKCASLGVQFYENSEVCSIDRTADIWLIRTLGNVFESPVVVNCAGAWGGKTADMLGESVPIQARAPMLMITSRMPAFITPVVGVQGRSLSFKQLVNGTVLIGGGHEGRVYSATNDTLLKYAGLATSAKTAMSIFPIMSGAQIVRCWAGIEGFMPDGIPVISPSNHAGAFHAFGFSAHGFQLGPIVGKLMSDLIVDGKTELPIDPFKIDRF